MRELTGEEFTAKDFRTWAGTLLAAYALGERAACRTPREAKRNVVAAVAVVAERLGNTVAVCRKCYVHPAVIDAYMAGALPALVAAADSGADGALGADEAAVLQLLAGA